MKRDTLLDFFADRIHSSSDFLVYDDGYRTYTYTYGEVADAANVFSSRLAGEDFKPGDRIVIWGENRPEWIVALWGCWLARCVVVPVDYRTSSDLLTRIGGIVKARIVLVGDEVPSVADRSLEAWRLAELLTDAQRYGPANPHEVEAEEHVSADSAGAQLAEIIFTSGATAEPKGVQLTHRNILANVSPVEREVLKYRRYAAPFLPLRFLNLLPLSHMFGQAMATFIPPMLRGVTVFMRGYDPSEIIKQIQSRRISVLVCVPKMLEVLREHVTRISPELHDAPASTEHVAVRWWRYRRVHRMFGFKFWAFVVGAAPLDPELETFWSRLGFLVIQGYGLTETAPIVTLNHPFRTQRGTVGKPIAGVEVKIAADGEILVRGENVTSGYYGAPGATSAAFEEGWFRTGDIGAMDASGRLTVRGRKKEMIVTPEGLNVFPEDVERVILDVRGVRDVAVVGATVEGKERVHAVLILDPGTEASHVARDANARLEDHQRVRSFSVWPGDTLPRTEGTQKLKRRELRQWVDGNAGNLRSQPASSDRHAGAIIGRFVSDREVTNETTLAELGLSSIEKIELMMALEQELDRSVDEEAFANATTVGDLEALVKPPDLPERSPQSLGSRTQTMDFPTWNRKWPARTIRRLSLAGFLLPLTRAFAWITVEGLDRLPAKTVPVIYAANHQSHMDGPVFLAALPGARRNRVATAAAKEFFAPHFHPQNHSRRRRAASSITYYLASLIFNVFPLPQREAGAREAIRYVGDLIDEGASVLIFPEGRRTQTGEIDRFQPGIGMIATRLHVPVVPVRLEGLDRILHSSWRMARPGPARVTFGEPLVLRGDDYSALAQQVEDAVRAL